MRVNLSKSVTLSSITQEHGNLHNTLNRYTTGKAQKDSEHQVTHV